MPKPHLKAPAIALRHKQMGKAIRRGNSMPMSGQIMFHVERLAFEKPELGFHKAMCQVAGGLDIEVSEVYDVVEQHLGNIDPVAKYRKHEARKNARSLLHTNRIGA